MSFKKILTTGNVYITSDTHFGHKNICRGVTNWRTHTDKVVPLGKRALLKDRILNGDFNPSSYFWQARTLPLSYTRNNLFLTTPPMTYN